MALGETVLWQLGKAHGWLEAMAHNVLIVLEARGVPITVEMRNRVFGCTELDQLEIWLVRAATARSPSDVMCDDEDLDLEACPATQREGFLAHVVPFRDRN
ncbi:hypothetical protein [Pendulispora albinea]|uniref:Uncharacterized protein n=1 Tax=Pendulispora albinea TaxID=2741071 RepID=A0ABZ2M904_9BACT